MSEPGVSEGLRAETPAEAYGDTRPSAARMEKGGGAGAANESFSAKRLTPGIEIPSRSTAEKCLEALLFASGESVPLARLADAAGLDEGTARLLLTRMANTYAADESGIQLAQMDDAWQLCTNPLYYEPVRRLTAAAPRRALTQALLETLSIIAFKQPVTKNMIEEIRGVNADHAVNRLVEYGLVEERGRLDAPGRPILFGTSEDFLRFYGFRSVAELLTFIPADTAPLAEADGGTESDVLARGALDGQIALG